MLDLDGNGRIGFEEWLLFVSFLSLPSDEIEGAEGCGEGGGWRRQGHTVGWQLPPLLDQGMSSCRVIGRMCSKNNAPPTSAVAFRIVDSNGSGSIELSELEFLLLNLYRRHAELAHGNEGSRLRKRVEGDFRQVDGAAFREVSGASAWDGAFVRVAAQQMQSLRLDPHFRRLKCSIGNIYLPSGNSPWRSSSRCLVERTNCPWRSLWALWRR